MRFLLSIFLILFGASNLRASPPETTLSAQSLATQMAVLHPHLDIQRYALGQLQAERTIEFNSIRHDPAALKAVVDQIASEVQARRVARAPQPALRMDIIAELQSLIGTNGKLISELGAGSTPVNQFGRSFDGYMPTSFLLLFPNYQILHSLSVTPDFAKNAQTRIANQDRVPVYLSVYFEVIQFNQSNVAQAIVSRFVAYADAERTIKLDERKETRDGKQLVKQSLLADGLTLNANPDHSTVIDGQYMLEYLNVATFAPSQCKLQKPIRGHRVVDCVRTRAADDVVEEERVMHRFVGGRRVQVDFFEMNPRKDADIAGSKTAMQLQYNQRFPENRNQHRWSDGTTIIEVDLDAMLRKSNKPVKRFRAIEYQNLLDGKAGYEVQR